MLTVSRDLMSTLVKYSEQRIPPAYGSRFTFETEDYTERQFTMRVTQCFYFDFFRQHDCAELTQAFCAWDRNNFRV